MNTIKKISAFMVLVLVLLALTTSVVGAQEDEDRMACDAVEMIETIIDDANGNDNSRSDDDVSAALEQLDEQFEEAWYNDGCGFAWTRSDVTNGDVVIAGPAYYWTDHLRAEIPEGVERILTQGNWGVWYVPEGVRAEINLPNGGGRGVNLPSEQDGGPTCPVLNALQEVTADMDPSEVIDYLDEQFGELDPYFPRKTRLNTETGDLILVWTDWDGQPPTGVIALSENSTNGGYGAWLWQATNERLMLENGGGAIVICDARELTQAFFPFGGGSE